MIPLHNVSHVLPPFVGSEPGHPALMSPYSATMVEFAQRFGTSPQRKLLIAGLLDYRARLSAIGVATGFQWLNGSFVEEVEITRSKPPSDIDLVTFARLPVPVGDVAAKMALVTANPDVFDPATAKATYNCDAYFVDLDIDPVGIVEMTRYWFGLFSHQRTTALWKGMLAVDLASDDPLARVVNA